MLLRSATGCAALPGAIGDEQHPTMTRISFVCGYCDLDSHLDFDHTAI